MTDLRTVIAFVARDVRASADVLNRLDSEAGDGDLGVTMSAGADALLELAPLLEGRSPPESLKACGMAMARHAPSTCGTLIAMGLLRAARDANEHDNDARAFASLLAAASDAIAKTGNAEVGAKTMLDALVPAASAASQAAAEGADLEATIRSASAAAEAGARATISMRAEHGRAGWLADRSVGHEDAGARLVAIVLAGMAAAVSGRIQAELDGGRR